MKRIIFILLLTQGFGAANAYTLEGSAKEIYMHYPVDSALVVFTNTADSVYAGLSHKKDLGYFSIADIPNQPSTGTITVTSRGYRPFVAYTTDVTTIPYLNLLLIPTGKGTAKLTGTITDRSTHNPVQGAQVILSLAGVVANFRSPYDTTISNADGTYGFDSLFPPSTIYQEEMAIIVSKPGYTPYIDYTRLLADRGEVNFQLTPNENKRGVLKGRITSESGQAAIANAKVTFIRTPGLFGAIFLDSARTDQNGDYVLEGIPASTDNVLSVCAAGFASKNSQTFRIDSGSTVIMNMMLQAANPTTRLSAATLRIAEPTSLRVYGINGRLMATFPNTDDAEAMRVFGLPSGVDFYQINGMPGNRIRSGRIQGRIK